MHAAYSQHIVYPNNGSPHTTTNIFTLALRTQHRHTYRRWHNIVVRVCVHTYMAIQTFTQRNNTLGLHTTHSAAHRHNAPGNAHTHTHTHTLHAQRNMHSTHTLRTHPQRTHTQRTHTYNTHTHTHTHSPSLAQYFKLLCDFWMFQVRVCVFFVCACVYVLCVVCSVCVCVCVRAQCVSCFVCVCVCVCVCVVYVCVCGVCQHV